MLKALPLQGAAISTFICKVKRSNRTKPPVLRPATFLTCCFAARPSPQGFLYDLYMCACYDCVLPIKMTCAVNLVIVREKASRTNLTFSWPSWIQRQDSVRTSGAKPGWSGWPWLLLCLVMLSMLHNMLLHRRLGRWIIVKISSAPAAEEDFTWLEQANPDMQVFIWSCQLRDRLLTRAWELHLP